MGVKLPLMMMMIIMFLPVCNEVVVADDPILPSDELPKGAADGAACSVGNRPEPTPWATPTHSQTQQRQQFISTLQKHCH